MWGRRFRLSIPFYLLPAAEAVTNANRILRHPVTPELEEVIHPVSFHRGPHEYMIRNIEASGYFRMHLEVL